MSSWRCWRTSCATRWPRSAAPSSDHGLTGVQDESQSVHGVIDRQLKNLSRLIDDLFDVSRITRGKIRLRKERLDVAVVVANAIESAGHLIEARRHD